MHLGKLYRNSEGNSESGGAGQSSEGAASAGAGNLDTQAAGTGEGAAADWEEEHAAEEAQQDWDTDADDDDWDSADADEDTNNTGGESDTSGEGNTANANATAKAKDNSAAPDLNTVLSERTGGKIKSEEDLQKILSRDLSKFPELEKMYEHFEKQGNLESYLELRKFGDINAMEPREIMKRSLALQFPQFNDNQLELYLLREYPDDSKWATSDEILAAQVKLERDLPAAKALLQSKLDEISTPAAYKAQQEAEKSVNDWKGLVADETKSLKEITIDLVDGVDPFKVTLKDADVQAIRKDAEEAYLNSDFWMEAAKDKDGNFDMQRLITSMYMARNWAKIIPALSGNAKGAGIEEVKGVLQNRKEVGMGENNSGHGSSEDGDWQSAFVSSLTGRKF